MNAALGDEVTLADPDSGREGTFQIVGINLFPQGDLEFDDGVWVTNDGAARLIGDPHDNAEIHGLIYDWAPGIDPAAADASVGFRSDLIGVAAPPVANLGAVVGLTRLLAIVFGVIVVALLWHASMIAGRRGRRELSTLQALGLVGGRANGDRRHPPDDARRG